MNISKKVIVTSAILSVSIFSESTLAESTLAESKWGIGLALSTGSEVYTDVDTETDVLPVLYYESENFYLLGPQFGYEFLEWSGLEFSFVGQYRFDGYDPEDDDAIFLGMEERSGSLDLGLEIEYETDVGDFAFTYLADATSEHKGNEMSLSYSLPIILSNGAISPYVSVTQMSDDLVDYYYGVRANEATSTRAFYKGESTTNLEVGINSQWQFGDHHKFVANLSFTSLGSEIKDSPIVDASNSTDLVVGYVYVF